MADKVRTRIEIDADASKAISALDDVAAAAVDADAKVEALDGETVDIDAVQATRDLADLEQAVRRLASEQYRIDVGVDPSRIRDSRVGIDELGRSAGSSRSALANMVGNTTQDLGALGGVAGSTGVALGQMGEYMADARLEGEGLSSVLGNFGRVALPVAGLAGAMFVLSAGAKQAADRTRDLEQATQDLTTATDEQALATWNDLILRSALDSEDLDRQLKELAETNLIGARRLLALSEAAGVASGPVDLLRQAIADAERGQRQAEETQRRYGDTATTTASSIDEQTAALARQADELDGVNGRWREYADLASLIVGNVLAAAQALAGGTTGTSFAPAPRLPYSTGPGPNNITIINPPGTPAATVESQNIYLSRNGVRAEP